MTKHKQYFKKMLEENHEDFKSFEEIHAQYHLEPEWNRRAEKDGDG